MGKLCDLLEQLRAARERAGLLASVPTAIVPAAEPIDGQELPGVGQVDDDKLCACLRAALKAELADWWNTVQVRPTRLRGLTAINYFRVDPATMPGPFLPANPARRMFQVRSDGSAFGITPIGYLSERDLGITVFPATPQTVITEEVYGAAVTYEWFFRGSVSDLSWMNVLEEVYLPGNTRPLS